MSNWRHVGSAESAFGKMLSPSKELVENTETGEQRAVWVASGETVGDAIARGQWADDNKSERDQNSSVSKIEDSWGRNDLVDKRDDTEKSKQNRSKKSKKHKSSSNSEIVSYYYAGSYESADNNTGCGVIVLFIIIGGLWWWFGAQTNYNKSGATSQAETLYVNALQLNLRAGPGSDYEKITTLNANDTVTLLETSSSNDGGNWVKIQSGSYEGWVNKKLLSKNSNLESITNGFLGAWEYDVDGHNEYLKVVRDKSGKLKFLNGFMGIKAISWRVEAPDVYLQLNGSKLQAEFVSDNFYPTHGMEFTYKINLEMKSNNRLRYSVWSSLDDKTNEMEASRIN